MVRAAASQLIPRRCLVGFPVERAADDRAGVTGDNGLAYAYATARVLRLADGPDEVHRNQIARLERRKYQGPASLTGGSAEVLPPDPSPGFRQRPVWIA